MKESVYEYTVQTISGESFNLATLKPKVLMVVNTASKCGFTNQYSALESLYKEYQEAGLEILGFPCNQFGAQEPGTDDEIRSFCQINYGVTFPMFSKVKVNGSDCEPLFEFLCQRAPGLMGSKLIKWNFTKFLIHSDGKTVERFAPRDKPEDLKAQIEKALA